jgi:glucose-1-phosphate cytidylyltransferase
MKVVILAGGLGTRLAEETALRPKPMIEIGGKPMLWHIMKIYGHYGYSEFVLCLGYKGEIIRDYFHNYESRNCDATVTLGTRDVKIHNGHNEYGWQVTLAETGVKTMTGGRVKRVARYLNGDQFMVTYGDGVGDVDIAALERFHNKQGKLGTVTAVHPSSFREKPQVHEGWINGGFMVFHRSVLDLIAGDEESLEAGLLTKLAAMKELAVYQHDGFWQCMDTAREMELLNEMWKQGKAPWVVWKK